MSRALSLRQSRILDMIREWVTEKGHPPSVRQIGEAVGLSSTSSVVFQLRALEDKGYIRRGPGPRALTLVEGPHGVLADGGEVRRVPRELGVASGRDAK